MRFNTNRPTRDGFLMEKTHGTERTDRQDLSAFYKGLKME